MILILYITHKIRLLQRVYLKLVLTLRMYIILINKTVSCIRCALIILTRQLCLCSRPSLSLLLPPSLSLSLCLYVWVFGSGCILHVLLHVFYECDLADAMRATKRLLVKYFPHDLPPTTKVKKKEILSWYRMFSPNKKLLG